MSMKTLTGQDVSFDLENQATHARVLRALQNFSRLRKLSAEEKDELIIRLADAVGVDHGAILRKRILHIMTPQEVATVAADGMDIQLHTHRHRTPSDRTLFLREIHDNRQRIDAMTGSLPTHFCYPSGVYEEALLPWLTEAGVESATTCDRWHRDALLRSAAAAASGRQFHSFRRGVRRLAGRRG